MEFHREHATVLVVVVCELVAGVTKLDLLGALPLFFFAATLAFVGFDLVHEWLVESHKLFARRCVWVPPLLPRRSFPRRRACSQLLRTQILC